MAASGEGPGQDDPRVAALFAEAANAEPRPMQLRRGSPRQRKRMGLRRACFTTFAFLTSILCLVAIAGGLFVARLAQGPIPLDVRPQIMAALNEKVGHGYVFDLASTSIESTDHGPSLTMKALSVRDSAGRPVVTAPKAAISVNSFGLLVGHVAPTRLEIDDVDLRLVILPDGKVAISAGTAAGAPVPLADAFAKAAPALPKAAPALPEATPALPEATSTLSTSALPEASGGDSAPQARGLFAAATPGAGDPIAVLPNGQHDGSVAGPSGAQPGGPHEPGQATPNEAPTEAALRLLAIALRQVIDATTASDSALASLDHVGVNGRLLLDDRAHGATMTFANTTVGFDKKADGSAVLRLSADGPSGRWSIVARTARGPDGGKSLTVDVKDLSIDEIMLGLGVRDLGIDFDTPISLSAGFHLGPEGQLDDLRGRFWLGRGYIRLEDPEAEPMMIEGAEGGVHFDPSSRDIAIEQTTLRAGESTFVGHGTIGPPRKAGEPWSIALDASGKFGPERPGEVPIEIREASLTGHARLDQPRLTLDDITVTGPEIDYRGSIDIAPTGDGFLMKGRHQVQHMPAKTLIRLWPSLIAAPVRAWFLQNCRGGIVESGTAVTNLTDADLITMRLQHSVPDDHVKVDFTVAGLDLGFMPGVPPLIDVGGSGTVTGHKVHFKATHGGMEVSPGHKLVLTGGDFDVVDSDPKPTPASIQAHATGSLDAVAELLNRPALKPFANVPIDSSAVKGQVDAMLNIALLLGDDIPPEDTKITVEATASNFSADKLIGKEGLVDATITLKADRNGINAQGAGRMFGAPATLELKKPAGGAPSEAVINLSLDDAARVKAGVGFGKALTGVVTAKISTSLTGGEKSKAAVDLDFTKAAFDDLVPTLVKPAGRPAKASMFVTQREGGATLDTIAFEGGGVTAHGSAELDAAGGFVSAKLNQLRFSAGDDIKLDAAQNPEGLKLVLHATSLDARPFLKWLAATGPAGGGSTGTAGGSNEASEAGKNLDLSVHANSLTGQNGQTVSGADLRVVRRSGQLKQIQMTGKFGRQRLVVSTAERKSGPVFVVSSNDAGSSLAFLDLYKRMVGGRLDANITLPGKTIQGYAAVHDFTLKEDPAMKKLASESLASAPNRSSHDTDMTNSAAAMTFTKLQGYFTRTGTRVDIHDAALFGPQAGATLEGMIDFAKDQIALSGTYVPIYGVNNLFSQIPLFGPILGGGAHEGLFALNFRIGGTPTSPVLNVNPLSALAPGFLRKVFGAINDAADTDAPARDRAEGPAGQSDGTPASTEAE